MSSTLENILAFQIRAVGLIIPETEYKAIADRKYRWDFAWPEQKLLVEVQGGIWTKGGHSTGKGITRDCEKSNLAALNGYRTLAVTGEQIRTGQALRWIQAALKEIA